MRTPIFALLLTFATWSTTMAQTERGVYSLGGSISYASSKISYSLYESTTTVLSLSPTCSYFVLDHLEITLAPAYETADAPTSTLFPGGSVTDVAVRLGFRYYYPLEDFALFVGPSGGLSWSKGADRTQARPLHTWSKEEWITFSQRPQRSSRASGIRRPIFPI